MRKRDLSAIRQALAAGADPNLPGRNGDSPLLTAIDRGVAQVKLLVEAGADVDGRVGVQRPLLHAVARGNIWATEELLRAGANPEIENGRALRTAVLQRRPRIVSLLLEYGAARDLAGLDSSVLASRLGQDFPVALADLKSTRLAFSRGFLLSRDLYGRSLLLNAVFAGRDDLVAILFDAGADRCEFDRLDAETGRVPLCDAASTGNVRSVEILLELGAAVDGYEARTTASRARYALPSADEETPLMLAAAHGHLEVVQVLLDHGADVTRRRAAWRRPCTAKAMAHENGHANVVRLLEERGALEYVGELPFAEQSCQLYEVTSEAYFALPCLRSCLRFWLVRSDGATVLHAVEPGGLVTELHEVADFTGLAGEITSADAARQLVYLQSNGIEVDCFRIHGAPAYQACEELMTIPGIQGTIAMYSLGEDLATVEIVPSRSSDGRAQFVVRRHVLLLDALPDVSDWKWHSPAPISEIGRTTEIVGADGSYSCSLERIPYQGSATRLSPLSCVPRGPR